MPIHASENDSTFATFRYLSEDSWICSNGTRQVCQQWQRDASDRSVDLGEGTTPSRSRDVRCRSRDPLHLHPGQCQAERLFGSTGGGSCAPLLIGASRDRQCLCNSTILPSEWEPCVQGRSKPTASEGAVTGCCVQRSMSRDVTQSACHALGNADNFVGRHCHPIDTHVFQPSAAKNISSTICAASSDRSSSAYFWAGAISGGIEAVVVHPFDMIKTRHQLNVGQNQSVIKSAFGLYREGGVLRLYRGLLPEILGMAPKGSAMYASYDLSRRWLASTPLGDSAGTAALAGLVAGVPEAVTVTPFQVVKVRLQAKENLGRFSGNVDCFVQTVKTEGVRGLFTGLQHTVWRNSVWNGVYFGAMHLIRHRIPPNDDGAHDAIATLVAGFAGGLLATMVNAPLDVVKSRCQAVMGAPSDSTWRMLRRIRQTEGLAACYKGFRPKAVRMAIGGAVGMASYEAALKML